MIFVSATERRQSQPEDSPPADSDELNYFIRSIHPALASSASPALPDWSATRLLYVARCHPPSCLSSSFSLSLSADPLPLFTGSASWRANAAARWFNSWLISYQFHLYTCAFLWSIDKIWHRDWIFLPRDFAISVLLCPSCSWFRSIGWWQRVNFSLGLDWRLSLSSRASSVLWNLEYWGEIGGGRGGGGVFFWFFLCLIGTGGRAWGPGGGGRRRSSEETRCWKSS